LSCGRHRCLLGSAATDSARSRGGEVMAAGWESGSTAARDCSCTTPALALVAGAVRQWFGEVPGPGARSGHSPQGGGPPPGQQSWCWVAAAQVIAGIAKRRAPVHGMTVGGDMIAHRLAQHGVVFDQ